VVDPLQLCLTYIPDCSEVPPGDRRGRVDAARNLRTSEPWTLPDSPHGYGGRRTRMEPGGASGRGA